MILYLQLLEREFLSVLNTGLTPNSVHDRARTLRSNRIRALKLIRDANIIMTMVILTSRSNQLESHNIALLHLENVGKTEDCLVPVGGNSHVRSIKNNGGIASRNRSEVFIG